MSKQWEWLQHIEKIMHEKGNCDERDILITGGPADCCALKGILGIH